MTPNEYTMKLKTDPSIVSNIRHLRDVNSDEIGGMTY